MRQRLVDVPAPRQTPTPRPTQTGWMPAFRSISIREAFSYGLLGGLLGVIVWLMMQIMT